MKKLNKYDFKVIDEFECNITKTVSVKRINNEIMFVKRGQTKMKRTNVEIARMVESKGYNFTEALESIDAGRTPEDEKKEITQEEIDEMVEAICLSFEIDVEG
jgi:hypothetical protein